MKINFKYYFSTCMDLSFNIQAIHPFMQQGNRCNFLQQRPQVSPNKSIPTRWWWPRLSHFIHGSRCHGSRCKLVRFSQRHSSRWGSICTHCNVQGVLARRLQWYRPSGWIGWCHWWRNWRAINIYRWGFTWLLWQSHCNRCLSCNEERDFHNMFSGK